MKTAWAYLSKTLSDKHLDNKHFPVKLVVQAMEEYANARVAAAITKINELNEKGIKIKIE